MGENLSMKFFSDVDSELNAWFSPFFPSARIRQKGNLDKMDNNNGFMYKRKN